MNTPPTAAPPAPPRADTARRPDDPAHARKREDFERVLREKSSARDDDPVDAGDDGDTADPPSTMAALMTWAAPLPIRRSGNDAGAAGATPGPEGATGAALKSALAGQPEAVAPTARPAEVAFEVSLRQPLGVALDLKAQRGGEAGAAQGWSLTIGSPVVDASTLARHAPRLNERLMARGLTRDHAHIEESDAEDTR